MEEKKSIISHILDEPDRHHPSDYGLIRFRQNEYGPQEMATMEMHIRTCTHCQDRLEKMSVAQKAFLEKYPAGDFLTRPEERKREKGSFAPGSKSLLERIHDLFRPPFTVQYISIGAFSVVLVLFVAALLYLRYTRHTPAIEEETVDTRLKGINVQWVVKRGQQQMLAPDDFTFQGGDVIGFRITVPRPMYVRVISIDVRGRVEALIPGEKENPLKLGAKKRQILPGSLTLEPPMASERIFVIMTEEPLEMVQLKEIVSREIERLRKEGKHIFQLTHLPIDGYTETRWLGVK